MVDSYQMCIGGEWVDASTGEHFEVRNPASSEQILARFPKAGREDAKRAVDAAAGAFVEWSRTPAPARGRIINRAWNIAQEQIDSLAKTMTFEVGKPLAEAKGEMVKGNNILEFYAGEGLRLYGETATSELKGNLLYTVRQPVGVVALITPWNFPWAVPCWKLAPALVAGNAVVYKPSSYTPLMGYYLTKIFEDAGLPPGVLNFLTGPGGDVGDALVEDDRVRAVSFTGSTEVGKGVAKAGMQSGGKKVQCEMGSKNPCLVLEDADFELAAEGIIKGAFGNAGQRCTATSRCIVIDSVANEFLGILVRKTEALIIGPGTDPKTDVGPVVSGSQMKTILDYIELGKQEGAKLLTGGHQVAEGSLANGSFIAPTIFDRVKPEMRIAQEEIFGPVLSVMRVKDFKQALEWANMSTYGLSSALYTKDVYRIMEFIDRMEAGMVHINAPTLGGEPQVPFGGIKDSGIGHREMAKAAIDFFTEWKTVFLDYSAAQKRPDIY